MLATKKSKLISKVRAESGHQLLPRLTRCSGFADEYNLTRFIKFNSKVVRAEWKDDQGIYEVEIKQADGKVVQDWCNSLINCSGVLNEWACE
jgi:cation diffusion facilitator CzcD-associated flavoprotein CzcO